MLGATGLATGLVLTGGGAYIAHTLAESKAHGATQVRHGRLLAASCSFSA